MSTFQINFFDEAAEQHKDAFTPIQLSELLDPDNPLPRATRKIVAAATRYAQDHTTDGSVLSGDDLTAARAAGPHSDAYRHAARILDDFVLAWAKVQPTVLQPADLRWVRARVHDNLLGLGAVEPLRRDPSVTEILVTAPAPHITASPTGDVFTGGTRVEVNGQLHDAPGVVFADDSEVLAFTEVLLPANRPTNAHPLQSGTLPDGSRVEVAHPSATAGNTFIAIRRHPDTAWTLRHLIDNGTISAEMACDLAAYVTARLNMVVAGGTGSGKTTTLNALTGFIDPAFHVAVIEDTKEIKTPPWLFASRRVGKAGRGDTDAITIRDHIKASLRSRPDIILVGEVRDSAALDMLKAMNTGHEGSLSTVHANSAHDTVLRLETMVSESGEVSESAATHAIASAVDIIVFQSRMPDRSRKITGIYEVVKPALDTTHRVEYVELRPLWIYDRTEGVHVKVNDLSDGLLAQRNITTMPSICETEVDRIAALTSV